MIRGSQAMPSALGGFAGSSRNRHDWPRPPAALHPCQKQKILPPDRRYRDHRSKSKSPNPTSLRKSNSFLRRAADGRQEGDIWAKHRPGRATPGFPCGHAAIPTWRNSLSSRRSFAQHNGRPLPCNFSAVHLRVFLTRGGAVAAAMRANCTLWRLFLHLDWLLGI